MISAKLEKHDIVRALPDGCDYDSAPDLLAAQRLAQHALVLDFVMGDPDRTARVFDQVLALAKAFALRGARDEAVAVRNDVHMFTDIRAAILKIQNPGSSQGGAAPSSRIPRPASSSTKPSLSMRSSTFISWRDQYAELLAHAEAK